MQRFSVAVFLVCSFASSLPAQIAEQDMLSPAEWQRVDQSIESALRYLSSKQQRNGSFPTKNMGQPGVTSLCVMAFVAQGHMPGEGPYGQQLEQALKFIVRCQKPNGLLALVFPGSGPTISRNVSHEIGSPAAYNHALSALLLSEVFSMGGGDLEANQDAIERAVKATLVMQSWPKRQKDDQGGWRYVNLFENRGNHDSDLSVTGWQLMFLRSAKNAGFDVPEAPIAAAVGYVQRCFQPKYDTFIHLASDRQDRRSRGMAGAGILAMAHAGLHNSEAARASGKWLINQGFTNYNESRWYTRTDWTDDRYHYGVFCSCQAMYQLGGEYWRQFFPPTAQVILANQNADGSWDPEDHMFDREYGASYTTALMALTLGAPNQLLPIFQR
jgi:hypothetical protein